MPRPSPQVFEARLDGAMGSLGWYDVWRLVALWQEGWSFVILEVPSNSGHSVILYVPSMQGESCLLTLLGRSDAALGPQPMQPYPFHICMPPPFLSVFHNGCSCSVDLNHLQMHTVGDKKSVSRLAVCCYSPSSIWGRVFLCSLLAAAIPS